MKILSTLQAIVIQHSFCIVPLIASFCCVYRVVFNFSFEIGAKKAIFILEKYILQTRSR